MRLKSLSMTASAAVISLMIALPAAAEGERNADDFRTGTVDSFAGAILAGRTAEADRDTKTAIDLYRKALDFEEDNSDIKQRLMVLYFNNGDFDEGVALAEGLKGDPVIESTARLALGINAIRQREFKNAQTLLDYSGVSDLERLLHGLLQSWAYFGDGQGEKAQEIIDALEGPEWYGIFKGFHSAALQEALGNNEDARRLYTEVITDQNSAGMAPDTYIRAAMALAGMEARAGGKQKALDAIATGSAFAPGYAPLKTMGERIEADNLPRAEIRTASEGASAVLYTIGSALNRSGAEDFVSLYLNFAKVLDPKNAATLIMLGSLAENHGQPERAIAIYQSIPEDSLLHRESELQLGLNLADLGRLDEAKQHLVKLIEDDPSDMRSYIAYGSVLSSAKDYRAMADNYDRAVQAIGVLPDRSHWNIFYQRGIAYERLKEWEKAEPNFERALELYPNQPQVMNYLGYSWIDMNIHLEKGMDLIREAVRLRPNDGYIVDSLGWAYYRLGDYENAVQELERAVEIRPGDPTINDHLGDAYWRAGRRLEARYQWERSLTMEPELTEIPKIRSKLEKGLPDLAPKAPSAANTDGEKNDVDGSMKSDDEPKKSQLDNAPLKTTTEYKVKPGQTLWTIADEVLGDGNRYREILLLNPSLKEGADVIHPGQIIRLP
ncbi:tetratricopeptide repeat protein [Hoeflea poritis]|uniref:Tetratricopeptide repeat protein n=1 Tax=Hoeflea poritis TaxID=2993659 RepID=A0ABT4VJJ8_9HYPH|nr:tetratricopeptide repeat protein [Hoeflea poritis]MDA4844873.1 tetratricopeptide repeat protein [Hoeflea poritis]